MLSRICKVFGGNSLNSTLQNDQFTTKLEEKIQGIGVFTAIDTELGIGIIDGRFRFKIEDFPLLPSPLVVGLRVNFTANRFFKLSEWEVIEIEICSDTLEVIEPKQPEVDEDTTEKLINSPKNRRRRKNKKENSESLSTSIVDQECSKAYKKVVSCKVTKIDTAHFNVQQSSQSAILSVPKEVFSEAHFVMIGDWLDISIERVNEHSSARNVLDIQENDKVVSVQWTEKSTLIGRVKMRQGLYCINDIYCPEKELSKGGKDLKVGDYCKVTYVLSDQYKTLPNGDGNITFTRRSQRVESTPEKDNQKEWNEDETALKQHQEQLQELCRNKKNIVITPRYLHFGNVKVNTEVEKRFEILNKSSDRVILNSVILRNDQRIYNMNELFKSVCEFTVHIHNPEGNNLKVVGANSTIYVTIICKPKLLGYSQEICLFNFSGHNSDFQIGRQISLKSLVDGSQNYSSICSVDNNFKKTKKERAKEDRDCLLRLMLETQSKVMVGPKSTRHPFFLPVKLLAYPIPEEIQHIYYEEQIKGGKGSLLLIEKYPNIDWCTLNFDNYEERFHLSLYLEELECRKLRKKLDLKSVTMSREFTNYLLFLSVPEYAVSELNCQRPLLSVGEIITCCYSDENKMNDLDYKVLRAEQSSESSDEDANEEKNQTILYQGYIYDIGSEGVVYIKFSNEFYQDYQEDRPVDVSFQQKRINFRRQYHGIVLGKKLLGKDWLFPSEESVEVKQPKIQYVELVENECQSVNKTISRTLVESHDSSYMIQSHHRSRKDNIVDKRAVSLYEHNANIEDRGVITNVQLSWENRFLNSEQKDAVRRILRGQCRPLPYIIFGPPGTGKSVTLVEAVMQVNKLDKFSRILVTAPSNQAADLICERLASSNRYQPGDFVRLNGFMRNPHTIPDSIKKFCSDGEKLNSIAKHKIIICTISTAGQFFQLNVNPEHFTHVFIDEAGYSTEPETLIACVLSAVEKQGQIILAGDPNQLQPVLFHNSRVHRILRTSLLERFSSMPIYSPDPEKFGEEIYNRVFITMLTRSYRLNEISLAVPSRRFYNGNLIAAAAVDKEFLGKLNFLPNKNVPLLFHGLRDQSVQEENASWCNNQEVQQCCKYFMELKKAGLKSEDIGIISLYRKQVEKIKHALKYQYPGEKDLPKVATIQEFQGGERKVIIISTVISYKTVDFSKLKFQGFLYSSKMFNVTVTRAKNLMIIVGDPHSIRHSNDWLDLLQHCADLDAYVGCDLPVGIRRFGDSGEAPSSESSIKNTKKEKEEEERLYRKKADEYSHEYYDDERTSAFNPFG